MKKKRRFLSEEINMMPLLDVLFVIVFTIILSGVGQQAKSQKNIQELEAEIERLQNELSEYKNKEEADDIFETNAIVISVDNIKSNEKHYFRIKTDSESNQIPLGINNTETFKKRIESYLQDIINKNDNQPVYIVFKCYEEYIYTQEYNAIDEVLRNLEKDNKEVFYKTNDKEKKR